MDYKEMRNRYLAALGGKCVRCGRTDRLEVHDTTGEHTGRQAVLSIKEMREFIKTGKIKPGRFLLCTDCHDIVTYDSDKVRAKVARRNEIDANKLENASSL